MEMRKLLVRLRRRFSPVDLLDYNRAYTRHVSDLLFRHGYDDAMREAVGDGESYEAVGLLERQILIEAGLKPDHFLVNVGCGSGRLEQSLKDYLSGPLLGTDVVPSLLKHARNTCGRSDWQFRHVKSIEIPLGSGRADMVSFFSVLTHTLHEDSYRYLCEASRVLKSGGRVVMSFLEFDSPHCWSIFKETVDGRIKGHSTQHNQFISRDAIAAWASHTGLKTVEILKHEDQKKYRPFGHSICVLDKT